MVGNHLLFLSTANVDHNDSNHFWMCWVQLPVSPTDATQPTRSFCQVIMHFAPAGPECSDVDRPGRTPCANILPMAHHGRNPRPQGSTFQTKYHSLRQLKQQILQKQLGIQVKVPSFQMANCKTGHPFRSRFFAAGFTNAIPSSSRPVRATFGSAASCFRMIHLCHCFCSGTIDDPKQFEFYVWLPCKSKRKCKCILKLDLSH